MVWSELLREHAEMKVVFCAPTRLFCKRRAHDCAPSSGGKASVSITPFSWTRRLSVVAGHKKTAPSAQDRLSACNSGLVARPSRVLPGSCTIPRRSPVWRKRFQFAYGGEADERAGGRAAGERAMVDMMQAGDAWPGKLGNRVALYWKRREGKARRGRVRQGKARHHSC